VVRAYGCFEMVVAVVGILLLMWHGVYV